MGHALSADRCRYGAGEDGHDREQGQHQRACDQPVLGGDGAALDLHVTGQELHLDTPAGGTAIKGRSRGHCFQGCKLRPANATGLRNASFTPLPSSQVPAEARKNLKL